MLALTFIRLLRDALLFVAAACLAIPCAAGIDAVDAYRLGQQVSFDTQSLLWLLLISCMSFCGWLFVQRREKQVVRNGLTMRWSERRTAPRPL
jgi:hypothetical protein